MTNEIKLTVRPFVMGSEKEAALKPLKEAAEVFAAWQDLCGENTNQCVNCEIYENCEAPYDLAGEIADTIQASCNLAARYNINLQSAMQQCEKKNRTRGRYPMEEEKHVESCGACGSDNCNCGGSRGDASVGTGVLREKPPEKMSVEELIEVLSFAIDNRVAGCGEGICEEWCDRYPTCADCRQKLLDLLETAYKQEKEGLRCEESYLAEECAKRDKKIEGLNREIADITHERDGLRNRLAELSEAGITELHRLLREAAGEAKNVTHNARVYIEKQRGSKDEHCGSRGSIGRNHGCDCGAQCSREHILPAKPPAQEMSEREKVLERLRGYAVYMSEPPSENANRLFACITGNKDARIACKDDVESVRDKLVELLNTPGWDYCETCELLKSDDGE